MLCCQASLDRLYRHLEFSREQSFAATIGHIALFFIPLNGYTIALPWFLLWTINAHLIAAMNVVQRVALILAGDAARLLLEALLKPVFLAALSVAVGSWLMTLLTDIPVQEALLDSVFNSISN